MDEDDVNRSILEYIKEIPPEKRADESIYKARLQTCKECSELINGMCRKCGCYVELRAIKPEMYCPSEEKKW